MAKPVIPSTQAHLPFAEIRDGVVVLKNGTLVRAVLVSSLNFALKSEREQDALVVAYQGFLNSLSFPIEILIQSRRLDLSSYLEALRKKTTEEENELLRLHIADYLGFLGKLISVARIMEKHFLVVVPYTPARVQPRRALGLFKKGEKSVKLSPKEFEAAKGELEQRVGIVTSGLANLGVRSTPLSTHQAIELLYATYNPLEAPREKLRDWSIVLGPSETVEGGAELAEVGAVPSKIPDSKEQP